MSNDEKRVKGVAISWRRKIPQTHREKKWNEKQLIKTEEERRNENIK